MNLSLNERNRRYAAIRELMKKNKVDCLVCISRDTYSTRGNTRYITNHGNNFGEEVVLFPLEGDPSIIASTIRGQAIERGGWVHNFIPVANVSERVDQLKKELARLDRGNKIGIVGISYVSIPVYSAVETQCSNRIVDMTWIFDQLRAIKSPEEIDKIRIAASIADKAYFAIRDMLKPGISDFELYGEAKKLIHQMGCEYSMELMMHYPYGRIMKPNEILSFEFTPAYQGYYAQLLAIMPITEYQSDVQKAIPIWQEAFAAGEEAMGPGKKVSEVHQAVSTVIRKRGRTHIPHRFGHSIGLDVIDSWEVVPIEDTELKPGMTLAFHPSVTPEPGGVKFGGGYTYLITDRGAEKLSKADLIGP